MAAINANVINHIARYSIMANIIAVNPRLSLRRRLTEDSMKISLYSVDDIDEIKIISVTRDEHFTAKVFGTIIGYTLINRVIRDVGIIDDISAYITESLRCALLPELTEYKVAVIMASIHKHLRIREYLMGDCTSVAITVDIPISWPIMTAPVSAMCDLSTRVVWSNRSLFGINICVRNLFGVVPILVIMYNRPFNNICTIKWNVCMYSCAGLVNDNNQISISADTYDSIRLSDENILELSIVCGIYTGVIIDQFQRVLSHPGADRLFNGGRNDHIREALGDAMIFNQHVEKI